MLRSQYFLAGVPVETPAILFNGAPPYPAYFVRGMGMTLPGVIFRRVR
jgi:hypothetical protein